MIKCTVVQDKMGNFTVFIGNKDFYLQTDYSKSAFAVDCGLVKAPDDWDGLPSKLPDDWYDVDFESITECPYDYYDSAE